MAQKGKKKTSIEASEAFLQYEEEIVSHPAYANMPDLRHEDGSIQWEAPSNRGAGKFQFSHDKRYKWWVEKAAEVGISTDEDKWISKVAKRIHPTNQRPCKVCGRIMDIRYCYLSANFMKRVKKLPFYDNSPEMDELTHIADFLSAFIDIYGTDGYSALPGLLRCSQVKDIPKLENDLAIWLEWLENEYIPKEPSMLGPGAMANPPDRLDGFHTYNRCCRPTADTGRSKENLASYSTDRRAFENWSDGNWITANKLMGFINSNAAMKQQPCANSDNGHKHPRPCSADHIGPISLGFCHRPEFQLLCTPCNSAKNNRMYYTDVLHLIATEKQGIPVTTWYANPIWQKCKEKVTDKETALRLSRVMRDNRNVAMLLLYDFMQHNEFLFLLSLMNLDYADFEYDIVPDSIKIQNQIVTVDFTKKSSTLRYVTIQKTRKIRVAFSALTEYAQKENRNGFTFTNDAIEQIKEKTYALLTSVDATLQAANLELGNLVQGDGCADSDIATYIEALDYEKVVNNPVFKQAKNNLVEIMELTASELSSKWDDPRYSREIDND